MPRNESLSDSYFDKIDNIARNSSRGLNNIKIKIILEEMKKIGLIVSYRVVSNNQLVVEQYV